MQMCPRAQWDVLKLLGFSNQQSKSVKDNTKKGENVKILTLKSEPFNAWYICLSINNCWCIPLPQIVSSSLLVALSSCTFILYIHFFHITYIFLILASSLMCILQISTLGAHWNPQSISLLKYTWPCKLKWDFESSGVRTKAYQIAHNNKMVHLGAQVRSDLPLLSAWNIPTCTCSAPETLPVARQWQPHKSRFVLVSLSREQRSSLWPSRTGKC